MADNAATVLTNSTPVAAPAAVPSAAAPPVGAAAALASVPAATDPAVALPTAANAPWYGEVAPEVKAWIDGKQYKDPATALAAHMSAEKLIGAPADQLIRKPKDANDVEGLKAYRAALGVPDAPEKYEITSPSGPAGADFVKWASNTFLEAGVPKDAAGAIVAKWNEYATAEIAKMDAQAKTEFANGMVQLKDQWGGAYDQRVELAKRALRTFGTEIGINEIGDAGFQALEKGAGGGVQLIKLLAAVGARTTEDTFQGGTPPQFTITKEQADAKIAELRNDKVWSSAYLNGDKNKQAEMMTLQNISAGTAK